MVRCISSFEHGVVLYMPVKVNGGETLADVAQQVRQRVKTEPKYKPLRTRVEAFDTFKVYVTPGQAKPPNLVIAPEGNEFTSDNWRGLDELGIEPGTELSFFSSSAYKRYKEGRAAE